jgi:hypothetical protein
MQIKIFKYSLTYKYSGGPLLQVSWFRFASFKKNHFILQLLP